MPAERAIWPPLPGFISTLWTIEPTGIVLQRHGVARLDVDGLLGGDDLVAGSKTLRRQDVGLLAVRVADQRDERGTVRIVFQTLDRAFDVELATLEVDETIGALVTAALEAGGDAAEVVAAALRGQTLGQRLDRLALVEAGAVDDDQLTLARGRRIVAFQCHFLFPLGLTLLPSEAGRDVDRLAFGQRHDGLLDVLLLAGEAAETLDLALADERVDGRDLDAEERFDSSLDLRLGSVLGDVEDDLVVFGHQGRLFGDRPERRSHRSGEDPSFEPLLQSFDRSLGKHELAAAQNVVNVDALNRQNIDVRDVLGGELEVAVELGAADEQRVGRGRASSEARRQRLGLGFGSDQIVDDDQVFSTSALADSAWRRAERANLLGKVVRVAANNRAVGLTTAAELRSACRMVTSAARTLLLVHLGTGAGDLRHGLGLVGALLLLGELPAHHAGENVLARLEAENRVGQGDLAGVLALEGLDVEFHYSAPSLRCCCVDAAGRGAFSGMPDLTASRTMIQEPLEPGTAPLTRIRPRSSSVETTSRFWVVTRVWPM